MRKVLYVHADKLSEESVRNGAQKSRPFVHLTAKISLLHIRQLLLLLLQRKHQFRKQMTCGHLPNIYHNRGGRMRYQNRSE
jgi:hypothetical protein